eukprot:CAMPEP_0170519520 /NCGR_PEP_ID=MMETSP0209-20121228/4906_1 /TAXON_ID=665100 ORGANISM="Litonotus pictus, Strain P1" /NCGR_SAMPLE_ID=MMETSP0209 /ASSEMBLY_ACC=CAM_ASM_000301 /LENGTH=274 /DNA_ID=CAMNT_0010805423 /DNA_START=466 /DNA_END=1287 /DNA_ORIENTATION=-
MEKESKKKIMDFSYDIYRKDKKSKLESKEEPLNKQTSRSESNQRINSDFYARLFLNSTNNILYNYDDAISTLKDDEIESICGRTNVIDFNEYMRIKLKYNPFAQETTQNPEAVFEIDEDLGIEEEEDFYLSELDVDKDFLKQYKIGGIWFDYNKLSKEGLNIDLTNTDKMKEIREAFKSLMEKDQEHLASSEAYLKELIEGNNLNKVTKENGAYIKNKLNKEKEAVNQFYPNMSKEEYREQALKNAFVLLANTDNETTEKELTKQDLHGVSFKK